MEKHPQTMQQVEADGCLLSVDVNLYYTTGRVFSGYFIYRPRVTPGSLLSVRMVYQAKCDLRKEA